MTRRFHALWLPAAAVLLPCVFVGVIAWQWLALERDATLRRSEQAAREEATALVRALGATGAVAAPVIEGLLRQEPNGPLSPRALPAPIAHAFLFNDAAQLVAPVELVDTVPGPSAEPALALVSRAGVAIEKGDWARAEALTREVFTGHRGARDEFGVSAVSYAAWQRAIVIERAGATVESADTLVRELGALVNAGYLGTVVDVTQLSLLAERLKGRVDIEPVLQAARRASDRRAGDLAQARAVEAWLAAMGTTAATASEPVVGVLRKDGSDVAMLLPGGSGNRLVTLVDRAGLAAWIDQWASTRPGTQVRLADPGERAGPNAFTVGLFGDESLLVFVAPRAGDAQIDGRRERLFAAAVGGALALTLIVGYLALRDVSRELKVASARASFIAGVTHELKTPLTSIRLMAETLRQDRAKPEARQHLLDTIVHETEQLSEVMDNVLSSARVESGTRTYDAKPANLGDALRESIARFEYVLNKEGFRLTLDTNGHEPALVRVDTAAFAQAVLNLLGNAVKYSGTSRDVRVTLEVDEREARVSVQDFGTGIPEAEQRRIFDRFYRVAATAGSVAGAGLGLSLVRHFADAHGGRVTVASHVGQGSVFTLHLPIADATSSSPAEAPAHG